VKIGIVTLSYNQRKFLEEAIRSVSSISKRERLKYIVVDPGSTDGSQELIQRYREQIETMIFERDAGPSDGLNKGFAACKDCEILGYLNADDRFRPGILDWVLSYFEKQPHIDVLLGSIAIIDTIGTRSFRARVPDQLDLRRYAIDACNVFQQGTFFRRCLFEQTGGFNQQNRTCWDAELLVDLALAGGRFGRTKRILGEFRIHNESITGSGRSAEQYRRDRARIKDKIESAGVPLYPLWRARLIRLIYRANPIRHASYILAS
jgi:glycosyltransferase involved in cell wall biosynthesis